MTIFDDGSTLASLAEQDRLSHDQAAADRSRLREAVVIAYERGVSKAEIHREIGVSRPTIDQWISLAGGGKTATEERLQGLEDGNRDAISGRTPLFTSDDTDQNSYTEAYIEGYRGGSPNH